jgi:hypothetical protein
VALEKNLKAKIGMNRKKRKIIKDNVRIGLFKKIGFKHPAKGQQLCHTL